MWLKREKDALRNASDTNRSRGVWSGREGSQETIGGVLEGAELGATFESSEDEFFGRSKTEYAAARGCMKGAHVEDMIDGVVKNLTPRSRPLALVTGESVTR